MRRRFVGLLIALLLVSTGACQSRPAPDAAKEESDTIARTEFTSRIENFFEYEPLTPGKPSKFLIHLTDLSDGAPVEHAEVTLTVRSGGNVVSETRARAGRVTGIYVAEITVPAAGVYDIEFRVRNQKLDERLALSDFRTT